MFGNNNAEVRVLESKLNIYEDLSREMLSKLENAVDKISEGNARIANILTKHDERIDQSIRSDELIIKMIEDHRQYDDEKFKEIETKIDSLSKFRWQVGAIGAFAIIVVGIISPVVLTTFTNNGSMVERSS